MNSIRESRRALGRFAIEKRYYYKSGTKETDWSNPFYRVRPRGFSTVLFDITKPEQTASADFERFMDAVQYLSRSGADL